MRRELRHALPPPAYPNAGSYFAYHIVRAIDIGVENTSAASAEQATMQPSTCIALLRFGRLKIKEAALTGVAFFSQNDPHSLKFRPVGQHVDELSMWDSNEFLIGAFAKVDILLPAIVLANDQLWRNVKYEDIYLKDYRTVPALEIGLSNYFYLYNYERPHQSLAYRTPAAVHFAVPVVV